MFTKDFDVFIAYHHSYEKDGPRSVADKLCDYLTARNVKAFYFPRSGRDVYKANIIDVMKSRTFLLVCNDMLNLVDGHINQAKHYELSTEIDAFYALTQLGDDVAVQDSKILYFGQERQGMESKLHELFANRVHCYLNEANEERSYEEIYQWILERQNHRKEKGVWQDTQTTNEVKEVFARRSSMSQKCNLPQMIASAKSIRCIGISNSELTIKMDIEAVKYALTRGAKIELVFLDPDSTFTAQREAEESLRAGKIRGITNQNIESALDFKAELNDSVRDNYRLYKYNAQPRMNMIIVDDYVLLQYYSNHIAGMSNPCFLLEKQKNASPLYEFCELSYNALKENATEIKE